VAALGFVLFLLVTAPANDRDPWYLRPLITAFIAAIPITILLVLPGCVVTDAAGIRQKLWWRAERHIPWSDVVSVSRNDFKEETTVYGKFSPPIVFSPYLVARPQDDGKNGAEGIRP